MIPSKHLFLPLWEDSQVKLGQHMLQTCGADHLARYGNILEPLGYDRYFWLPCVASKLGYI